MTITRFERESANLKAQMAKRKANRNRPRGVWHNTWNKGEGCCKAKLTENDVRLIRQLRADGMKYRVIASKFNIDHSTVWQIVNYYTWNHVR